MSQYQELAMTVRPFEVGRADTIGPALGHRLAFATAAVGRSVASFFAAGQLTGTGAAEQGRWTGARC